MANHSMICLKNPMNSTKRQKDMTVEDEHPPQPRSVGVQYVTAEEQRAVTNSSRENEAAGTKQKSCSLVDVSGGEGKFRHCKEPYCIGS